MPARWWNGSAGDWRDYELPFLFCCPYGGSGQLECLPPCQQIRTSWTEPLSSRGSKGSHSYPFSSRLPCGYCPIHLTLDYHTLLYQLWPRYCMFCLSTVGLMAMPHLVHIYQYETAWGLQCPECSSSPDNVKRATKIPPTQCCVTQFFAFSDWWVKTLVAGDTSKNCGLVA